MDNYQVFISYRRTGGADFAARIADRLKKFGYQVFFDIESMNSGKFDDQIFYALDQCEDVVVILPPNGLDRCQDESDWVRGEIARAIESNKNIVPVMMQGFEFPANLPEEISKLPLYEGVKYFNEYFDAAVERIKQLLSSKPAQTASAVDEDLDAGVRFLNYNLYDKAITCFEKALMKDISNPEIYFYYSIALLGGVRPFLTPRSKIVEIEKYLNTAIEIEAKPIYLYFLAFVKFDFYFNKRLNSKPPYEFYLTESIKSGILESDKANLFKMLACQRPEVF